MTNPVHDQQPATAALALAMMLALAAAAIPSAHAQAYKVLYSFKSGTDGNIPQAGLVRDPAGNLYGTTSAGGASNSGTVFKLSKTGAETLLHSFAGGVNGDGALPLAGLVRDSAGNLYGTTYSGGSASNFGTVYKVDSAGVESVLYTFAGGTFGANPESVLVRDAAGNLYGTTFNGGAANAGTVFKVDSTGAETVLYSFTGSPDGANPAAGLIPDASGNFYGTTAFGGASQRGTVFKVDATGAETVLYSFAADGAFPFAGLIRDAAGNLYGTTSQGGVDNLGTVFKVNSAGAESLLHAFNGSNNGAYPYAALIRDGAGNLYGTTERGGLGDGGTVFKLDKTGAETVIHGFGGAAGRAPLAGLILSPASILYGTTMSGGTSNNGVVFELKP
ncbi:MAG TPA: choice-of-anchor tandem repeat GloVer-containing protein [Terriglobia bacterium]|nr:choice-of-anchor tandem repeat GloVer-containing protein [Terriglobia bacterium]